jgi:two-component system, OmpR family, osmolarity sensor histidine kinase EnvZ
VNPFGARGTLVRRLTLGVLGVSALALVFQAMALLVWLEPVRHQMMVGSTRQATAVELVLQATPSAQRAAAAAQMSGPDLNISQLAEAPVVPALESTLSITPPARLREEIRAAWGPDRQVWAERAPDGRLNLNFLLRVRGEHWLMSLYADPPIRAVGFSLLLWLMALGVLALTAQMLAVRAVARPLQRLAEQIDTQRDSPAGAVQALQVSPQSSQELVQFVASFNQMVARVEAVQRERQQLLAGVSHDLRTPLARLRLRVETQLSGSQADGMEADLLALGRIVDQFLAYVQGEAAPRLGLPRPLHLTLQRSLAPFQQLGMDIALAHGAQERARAVKLPEGAIERVLTNLIDNAQAYGRAPVRVNVLSGADGSVTLHVSDAGPGMDAAQFEAACEPFVRLDTTRANLGHCGLGLAIVAQLARHLGAQLVCVPAAPGRHFAIELRGLRSADTVRDTV